MDVMKTLDIALGTVLVSDLIAVRSRAERIRRRHVEQLGTVAAQEHRSAAFSRKYVPSA